jgi:glycosyltransferase involved in cell wall biosynthesis
MSPTSFANHILFNFKSLKTKISMNNPKIRYLISTAFAINPGGTSQHATEVISHLQNLGLEVLPLDFMAPKIDFDVLLVVSFSFHNPDMLEKYKKAGVKIILIPIFDRTKPVWSFGLYKIFEKSPIRTLFNQRKRILAASDIIICNGQSEKQDLISCYDIDVTKTRVLHLGVSSWVTQKAGVSPDLFYQKYGIRDFVFYPAAEINSRKNQMLLLDIVQNTNIKVVFTGCDKVLVKGFLEKCKQNKNILCLGKLSFDELASAYKNAKVCISISNSETAGLALLEAVFFGCNVVASNIPAFVEYLSDFATFVNQTDKTQILQSLQKSLQTPKQNHQETIKNKNSWQNYAQQLVDIMNKIG